MQFFSFWISFSVLALFFKTVSIILRSCCTKHAPCWFEMQFPPERYKMNCSEGALILKRVDQWLIPNEIHTLLCRGLHVNYNMALLVDTLYYFLAELWKATVCRCFVPKIYDTGQIVCKKLSIFLYFLTLLVGNTVNGRIWWSEIVAFH